MSILITLRDIDGQVMTFMNDGPRLVTTPLDQLPTLAQLQRNPYELGRQLTAALGGQEMLWRLEADPDGLLLLDADARADAVAWRSSGSCAANPWRCG